MRRRISFLGVGKETGEYDIPKGEEEGKAIGIKEDKITSSFADRVITNIYVIWDYEIPSEDDTPPEHVEKKEERKPGIASRR